MLDFAIKNIQLVSGIKLVKRMIEADHMKIHN